MYTGVVKLIGVIMNTAFNHGYESSKKEHEEKNPYTPHSQEWHDWLSGWLTGKSDEIERVVNEKFKICD